MGNAFADIAADVDSKEAQWTWGHSQEISITDVMYTLKRLAVRGGFVEGEDAPALAKAFTGNVDRYGRSFEVGLASRYYLTRRPGKLMRMVPLGMAMLHHGRMALRPKKIRQLGQLQAVIDRAKEIEGGES